MLPRLSGTARSPGWMLYRTSSVFNWENSLSCSAVRVRFKTDLATAACTGLHARASFAEGVTARWELVCSLLFCSGRLVSAPYGERS